MTKMPKGVKVGNNKIKIATVFDKAVFEEICERAIKENKTFYECANDVAKLGLFDLKEAEK
jgi:uncharacterized protein YbcV (DUF1398 family)